MAKPKGKLYAFFVDFSTAFDTVNRRILWSVMKRKGIPGELISVIQKMYEHTAYRVGDNTFQSHMGVKQGCPLSPLLFALYIADLDKVLERNQSGGVVFGRTKVHCLAFADDLVLLAGSAAEMKDMIKALLRFARIMVFGRRGACATWLVEDKEYEEARVFKYLGITLKGNGGYQEHVKETMMKARRRMAEVWGLGERLFKNNFQIRMAMYKTLVTPIILYGAEVTGYFQFEEYEKNQRKYVKWLLGLPNGTRNEIVESEGNTNRVNEIAFKRAVTYDCNIKTKDSPLLRAVSDALWKNRTQWGDTRAERLTRLGWGETEARGTMNSVLGSKIITQRITDIAVQEKMASVNSITDYQKGKLGLPTYLRKVTAHAKTIARFRCGAEDRGKQKWRGTTQCRVCGMAGEDIRHLVSHDIKRRNLRELLKEDGTGLDWMLAVGLNEIEL